MKFECIEIFSGNFKDIKFPAVLTKKKSFVYDLERLWMSEMFLILLYYLKFISSAYYKNMYNELKVICSCKTPYT